MRSSLNHFLSISFVFVLIFAVVANVTANAVVGFSFALLWFLFTAENNSLESHAVVVVVVVRLGASFVSDKFFAKQFVENN